MSTLSKKIISGASETPLAPSLEETSVVDSPLQTADPAPKETPKTAASEVVSSSDEAAEPVSKNDGQFGEFDGYVRTEGNLAYHKAYPTRIKKERWQLVFFIFASYLLASAILAVVLLKAFSPLLITLLVVLSLLWGLGLFFLIKRKRAPATVQLVTLAPKVKERFVAEAKQEEAAAQQESVKIAGEPLMGVSAPSLAPSSSVEATPSAIVAPAKSVVYSFRDFPSLEADFIAYFSERGISIDPPVARNLLAGISSSRCLLISGVEKSLRPLFAEVLSSFFGSVNGYLLLTKNGTEAPSLFVDAAGNETRFVVALRNAESDPKAFCFGTLDGLPIADLAGLLSPFAAYFENPVGLAHVEGNGVSYPLVPNFYVLVFVESGADGALLPYEESRYSICLSLIVQKGLAKPSPNPKLSFVAYSDFFALLSEGKEKAYLSEDLWKKVDALEAYFAKRKPYEIGNVLANQLEDLSSTLLLLGGESMEALDAVLATKLLPPAFGYLGTSMLHDDDDLGSFLDKTFGDEGIPQSQKLLRLMGEISVGESK